MPRAHRDSKGYYRALGVPTDAPHEEVRLAYALLKGSEDSVEETGAPRDEIDRAYEILTNPARRQAYDRAETASRGPLGAAIRMGDAKLLLACALILAGILAFVWYPLYGSRLRSFSAGDQLVDLNGRAFGVVLQVEERHGFPKGISAPAYLVELSETRDLRWFPRSDLQASCRRGR